MGLIKFKIGKISSCTFNLYRIALYSKAEKNQINMFDKIKNKIDNLYVIRNYQNIYRYLKPYKIRALLAVLITLPVGMMDALIALALKPYMDVVMIEKNLSASSYIPILIILFSLLQSAFNYSSTYLNAWVGAKISCGLKYDLFQRLMRYDARFFDRNTSGAIQMRFNSDVDTACSGLLNNMKLFSTRFFSSLSLIIVLMVNSWQLAIVALVVLLGALYPLTSIRSRIGGIMAQTVFSGAAIITHYGEAFNGNRVVMSYNLYDHLLRRFSKALNDVFTFSMKMVQRTGILSPLMHFIISIGIAAIIWLGSYLIVHSDLTPGGFVSFITALLLLYQPVKSIGNDYNAMQVSLMAMERVFDLMKAAPAIENRPSARHLERIHTGINYQNVCFEYEQGRPILQHINLQVKVGETVALVGNSGGGKTTLVNLLPRFYDVTAGSILIDDTDVRDFTIDSLRDKIAVVFQDNFLFSGTIRENILVGKEDASADELKRAIKSSYLEEFVTSLERGIDTEIGERGVLLSGGQKQRVAIARAFLKNAPIVILDEATSALDNKSEAVVQEAIENLMKDRTVFIIAHRLSTVRSADKIVVINHGKIHEIGSHEELIAKKNSEYASLYYTQFN
ncbi:MAG: ABC transporter ATP-binding protein/permease [Holosporaceae bacterium]|jgi:subfamily B ATP-binding cassette protein MsbA|nr:ABC transporter ATP-binding protein/permease [Holosporaceae bacterium]